MPTIYENLRGGYLRRKFHIPWQMPASPVWLTTQENANLGTGHRAALQVRQKKHLCSTCYCHERWGLLWAAENQPCKLHMLPSLQAIFIPLVDENGIFCLNEKVFYGYFLHLTVVPRINIFSHGNWREKQVHSRELKDCKQHLYILAPSGLS